MKGEKMTIVEPIRLKTDLEKIEYVLKKENYRNYVLFKLGINFGLRISDLLKLKVKDVKNKNYILITEKKTRKKRCIPINLKLKKLIGFYVKNKNLEEALFAGNNMKPLSRVSAYRIINNACKIANIEGNFGTHTLRKTFGYHFYKKFKDVAMLQKILNHSHPSITLKYIGIDEEEIYNSYMLFSL